MHHSLKKLFLSQFLTIRLLTLALLTIIWNIGSSQHITKDKNIGSTLVLQSSIMNDERTIEVFVPDGYAESEDEYPVLYILDGQRYFLHGVSLYKSFSEFKQTPGFIIVGIAKKASDRNGNFNVNSDNYINFLKEEVIALIDSHYRTNKQRIIFGWALGGGFVIQTLVSEPTLFDAYIAASPFPVQNKLVQMDRLFMSDENLKSHLYFTSGSNEGMVKEETKVLQEYLESKAPEKFNWTFKEFEGEEHRSTPFTSMYHGLKQYFTYYPELQFNNLDEFLNAGGLEYVTDYYKKRALKYGLPEELSDWTMFSITRNAIRADDFAQFDLLMKTFRPTNFINRLRVNRACSIASYLSQNNHLDSALKLYLSIADHHPSSPLPVQGIADTYEKMNNQAQANYYYSKAEKMAKD